MKIQFCGKSHEIHGWLKGLGKSMNQDLFRKTEQQLEEAWQRNNELYSTIEDLKAQLLKSKETKEHAHLEAMKDVVRKGKAWAKTLKTDEALFFQEPTMRSLYIAIGNCPDVD